MKTAIVQNYTTAHLHVCAFQAQSGQKLVELDCFKGEVLCPHGRDCVSLCPYSFQVNSDRARLADQVQHTFTY